MYFRFEVDENNFDRSSFVSFYENFHISYYFEISNTCALLVTL